MKRMNHPERKERRREEAKIRQDKYDRIHGTAEERRAWRKLELSCRLVQSGEECEHHMF